ncbi:dynein axonemal assembly factor 6 [Marchantia polymorpha subsp. ruderalis]|uniref:PIH1D1/2/3 CS-like domain-containing protein n=2 Tax=Marchantia polymorpha TaxID=3197 RepID=A0AAF6B515_MARPO|nr:hypothetical protein MARPO_0066s0043 [Marchantia polymorpha]BBN07099.1 hypothetical protein Mp_4g01000 [Marchantia polymorpha subsp. ruderalis]|eukprot:PTQ36085.1 hypothetical protein MARPO_0066s0043 [Marchantia polymorpha]
MTIPYNELQALSTLLTKSEEAKELKGKERTSPCPSNDKKKESDEERIARERISLALDALKDDKRTKPTYDFLYKQSVSPEDVYFQMSGKDPSSLCCDDMVMRIQLPGTEAMHDLKLDLKPTYMKLLSPIYCLGLFLPHKIDPKCSSAEWDYTSMTLSIVMRIVRED